MVSLAPGHKAMVHSPYDQRLIPLLRHHGGYWNRQRRVWEFHTLRIPDLSEAIQSIGYNVAIDDDVFEDIAELNCLEELSHASAPSTPIHIDMPLYDFQKIGVQFGINVGGRCIIADEQGLGKTVQSLAILQHFNPSKTLIIAPASVLENWRREIKQWLGRDALVYRPGRKQPREVDSDICIVSYDSARKLAYHPEMLIIDEAHYIRNPKSLRSRFILEVAPHCKWVVALTGTPMVNRPIELWPLWQAVQPASCPDWWAYARLYCNAHKTTFGWDVNGASNTAELSKILRTFMLRRKKADVLSELPPIIRRIVPLCPDVGSSFLNMLRAYAKGEKSLSTDRKVLIQNALQEFSNSAQEKARLPELEDYITNMLRQNGGKVVIFARHHVLIDAIREILDECSLEYITITGKTRQDDRQYLIDKFNTEEYCKVAILSLGVGCEGINMQSASQAIVAELDWSPNVLAQAESRLHRIGQKGSVIISYLLYGQFEDKLYQVLAKKSRVIGGVIDGNYTEDNLDLLQALVEDMRN